MTEMPLERLQKYGNRNYFRVTVPKDLRAVFGKREVKVSLKTSDLEEAKKRVRQLSAEFDRDVEAYRAILQSPTQLTDLTPEQIRDMVRAWRDEGMDGVNHSIIPDDPTHVARGIEYDLGSMEKYDHDAQTSVTDRAIRILAENGIRLEPRNMSRKLAGLTNQPYKIPNAAVRSDQFTILVKAIRAAISEVLVAERDDVLGRYPLTSVVGKQAEVTNSGAVRSEYPSTTLAMLKKHFDESDKRAQRLKGGVKDKHTVAWRVLQQVLGEDRVISSLTRSDFERIFHVIKSMPPKIDAKFPNLPLLKAVEAAKEQGMTPMAPRTVNGYMDAIDRLLKHAVQAGMRPPLDFGDLRVDVPNWAKDQRQPFSVVELNSIFSSYLYVEGARKPSAHKRYNLAPRDSYRYWLPLISLFSGMRIGEIAQLLVSDIEEIDGVQCFRVQLSEDDAPPEFRKKLKNPSAERIIPVHPELLAIGFSQFVAGRKVSGGIRLFSDATLGSDGTFSQNPSKWFGIFLSNVIEKTRQKTFHSFRHTFRDATREAHLDEDTVSSLMGWTKSGKMSSHYGAGLRASSLAAEIAKVHYEGFDLSHLHERPRSRS